MSRNILATAVLVAAAHAAAVPAAAQDAPAEKKLPKWSDTAELGWVATSGNSESSSFGFKDTLTRTGKDDLFELKLGGIKVKTTTTTVYAVGNAAAVFEDKVTDTTAENYFLTGRYDRNITPKFFWFAGAGWDRNIPAGIQDRYVGFGGVGNNWFTGERRKWRTDYSATGTKQDNVVDDPTFNDTFFGVRVTSTFLQQFGAGDNGTYGNDTIIDENLDETSDWRVNMTNWVSLNFTSHLALKVSLQWLYDNLPSLEEINIYDQPLPSPPAVKIGTTQVPVDDLDSIFTTALVIKY